MQYLIMRPMRFESEFLWYHVNYKLPNWEQRNSWSELLFLDELYIYADIYVQPTVDLKDEIN